MSDFRPVAWDGIQPFLDAHSSAGGDAFRHVRDENLAPSASPADDRTANARFVGFSVFPGLYMQVDYTLDTAVEGDDRITFTSFNGLALPPFDPFFPIPPILQDPPPGSPHQFTIIMPIGAPQAPGSPPVTIDLHILVLRLVGVP